MQIASNPMVVFRDSFSGSSWLSGALGAMDYGFEVLFRKVLSEMDVIERTTMRWQRRGSWIHLGWKPRMRRS